MISTIHLYGARNEALHNHLDVLLANGDYREIAETISPDPNNLGSIIPTDGRMTAGKTPTEWIYGQRIPLFRMNFGTGHEEFYTREILLKTKS